ncbi:MAG: DUF1566 domain-containing protein [Leptospiraceae bacterium]|nr:DUF1566 domain-containing protein [Leptospiraceae bacterium]
MNTLSKKLVFYYGLLFISVLVVFNCKGDKKGLLSPDNTAAIVLLNQSSSSTETATVEITGTAKDSDGNTLSSATVSASESSSSSIQSRTSITKSTTTDSSGNFTLYLKVTKFKISIYKSDGTEVGSFYLDIQNTTEKHITPSNVSGLQISLTSGKPVGGDTDLLLGSSSSASTSGSSGSNTPSIAINCSGGSCLGVLKTGQTTSYMSGDDGSYQKNISKSYTDNGDGTIKDNYTGLIWQKCSKGQSGNDCATGTVEAPDYATADGYCNSLTLAGKTWRLPTQNELLMLVDSSKSSIPFVITVPTINETFFPATAPSGYRSSDSLSLFPNAGWQVYFRTGYEFVASKTDPLAVRCVSGSQHSIQHTYTDNGNGTVTDLTTALVWQKCLNGLSGNSCETGTITTLNWNDAISYCNNLSLGGKTNWRLPNLNELLSIKEHSKASVPLLNTTVFPASPSGYFWTSTTDPGTTTQAKIVSWDADTSASRVKATESRYMRCVADP